MGGQNRSEKEFEVLAALLADIAGELESESEEDRSRIREIQQHCLFELALLRKAEKEDSEKEDSEKEDSEKEDSEKKDADSNTIYR